MDYKSTIASMFTGLCAYLAPIHSSLLALLIVFGINFAAGLLADLLNDKSFDFKKAWRFMSESAVIFTLICAVYIIGHINGDDLGTLRCVSYIIYTAFYFYGVNILRNALTIIPPEWTAYKVVSFLYYIISIVFIKKVPGLSNYLKRKESNHAA